MLNALAPLLLLAAQDPSGFQPEDLSPQGQRSWRFLASLEHFHDGSSGFAGSAPDEVHAMRWLWKEDHAVEAFHALLDRDGHASALYGLVGLYYADPEAFDREVQFHRRLRGLVPLMSSCTYDDRHPVATLVEIREGEVARLDSRTQTTKQWATKYGKNQSGYKLDILGGGLPCMYRNGGGWQEEIELQLPRDPSHDTSWQAGKMSENGQRAFEILRTTQRFTDDAITQGGITPVEVKALRWLWKEPTAEQAFHALMRDGKNSVGSKLYALCGLYYVDRQSFREELAMFLGTEQTTEYFSGCMRRMDNPVGQIVFWPYGKRAELAEGQTVKDWAAEHAGEESFMMDIAGGGIPNTFRHGGGWYEVKLEPLPEAEED